MCGIFAGLGFESGDSGTAGFDRLRHRGLDASGRWQEGPVLLAHRRLAIVGLGEAGSQPMLSASERFVLTFNG